MCECTCGKKQKSLADAKREAKEFYGTFGQTCKDFYLGQKVKIIVPCQDFHFWDGEKGTIIATDAGHYCMKVLLDEPRHYQDFTLHEFNFMPEDLIDLKKYKKIGPMPSETI